MKTGKKIKKLMLRRRYVKQFLNLNTKYADLLAIV